MSDVIRLGQEAHRVLNEPVLKQAFEGVRLKILERIEETAIGDVDTQHELALCLQSLKSIKRYLENFVRNGQLEADRVEKDSKWKAFMKRTGAING